MASLPSKRASSRRAGRTLAALAGGLLLAGCTPSIHRCERLPSLRHPDPSDAFERRLPVDPAPIAVKDIPAISVSPKAFDEDRWGNGVFDKLPPRQAPEIRSSGPGRVRTPLVCSFSVQAPDGVDGIDDLHGRTLISISTPDLLVWADFEGTKITKGPAFSSSTAIFTFRADVRTKDHIVFEFGDFDLFSSNEYIGRIEGAYPGSVPFQIRGGVGTATCRAATTELIEAEAKVAEKRLDAAIAGFEAWTPTLDEPLGTSRMEPVESALGALEYFTEEGAAREATLRRLNQAAGRQWRTYVDLLRKRFDSLPPPGGFLPVDGFTEARVAGLSCRIGDRYRRKDCAVELSVRLRKEPGGLFCPLESGSLGDFGPLSFVRSDGRVLDARVDGIRAGEVWLDDAMALTRLLPGAVITIRLLVDDSPSRESEAGWDVPLLRVGDAYFRLHGG